MAFKMTKKDDALWFKHLVEAKAVSVRDYCDLHSEGDVFNLVINGEITAWERAAQGGNLKPTTAVKPADHVNHWHSIAIGSSFRIDIPGDLTAVNFDDKNCDNNNNSDESIIVPQQPRAEMVSASNMNSETAEPVTNFKLPVFSIRQPANNESTMLSFGIDTAWTTNNPSGVALLEKTNYSAPRVLSFAGSYAEFISGATPIFDGSGGVTGSWPDMADLLHRVRTIAGHDPDIISLDIPLSPDPITERRAADSIVSRLYGGKGASTHSPSAERPGPISAAIFAQLVDLTCAWVGCSRCDEISQFVETYPHVVIIEMLELDYRLPYKVDKMTSYWPNLDNNERYKKLCSAMEILRNGMIERIDGLAEMLPEPSMLLGQPKRVWKKYEDILDALVCAWLGCEYLSGRAVAYGDATSAIWVPSTQHRVS